MAYSSFEIWLIILILGVGTFALRYSFLGLIGSRELPEWALRHLRYTAVAIMPGMIAPMILFPAASGGALDPLRMSAAGATIVAGLVSRNVVVAIVAGTGVLIGGHLLLA
ncbi:MAG: AzlD domain-containing protein [Rhodobacteraceae bacterium]|nr:AzlD domain-containing protein [Paracoccaceae bacterium]